MNQNAERHPRRAGAGICGLIHVEALSASAAPVQDLVRRRLGRE